MPSPSEKVTLPPMTRENVEAMLARFPSEGVDAGLGADQIEFRELLRAALEGEGGGDPPYENLREAVAVALAMLEENRQAAAEQVLHRATQPPAPEPSSCDGSGRIERPAPHHGTEEDDWIPCVGCPACQPEPSKGDEDPARKLKPAELARAHGIQLWTPVYRKGKGVGMKKTDDGTYLDLGDFAKFAAQPAPGDRRVEYRVVADLEGYRGPVSLYPSTPSLADAQVDYELAIVADHPNLRIQSQTTVTGPWTDLPEGEGQ